MSLEISAPTPRTRPEVRRRWRPGLAGLMLVTASATVLGAWSMGLRPAQLWASAPPPLATLEVDRGDVALVVVENGALESADNATVRCEVEALIGMVGGTQAGGQGGRGGTQGSQQSGTATTTGGTAGTTTQATTTSTSMTAETSQTKAQAKDRSISARTATTGGSASASTTAAGSSSSTTAAGQASGATAASTAGSGAAGSASTTTSTKPVIRSFTYEVVPYVSVRPKTTTTVQAKPAAQAVDPAASGGGRGRQNSADLTTEKPGSTRIISILDEGTRVKAGDIVCELDSSAFRDELQSQRIRTAQAKAGVEQVQSILEVNEITLREYRDGIYPQDAQLIRQYITTCRIEQERARRNLAWSQATAAKGLRTPAQLRADVLALQQADNALNEAEGMARRLESYTAPKLIKSLEAKIEAIRADKLNQDSAYELELQRLKRLEKMVANCTLRAPRDGIVVFVNQANGWGRVDVQIQEGATVREGQPIFEVPNPERMQVKARINESKLALVQTGQPALIRIDAFPDRPLRGVVTEITAIPEPANRASPDIKVYFATVKIESGGFAGLRPGLSAEVVVQVEARSQVTRVPVQAIRWVDGQAFAAVATPSRTSWQWRRVDVGLTDPTYVEVVSGLSPGDRVVDRPEHLPAPRPSPGRLRDREVDRFTSARPAPPRWPGSPWPTRARPGGRTGRPPPPRG